MTLKITDSEDDVRSRWDPHACCYACTLLAQSKACAPLKGAEQWNIQARIHGMYLTQQPKNSTDITFSSLFRTSEDELPC
jgi:hypothetical protein